MEKKLGSNMKMVTFYVEKRCLKIDMDIYLIPEIEQNLKELESLIGCSVLGKLIDEEPVSFLDIKRLPKLIEKLNEIFSKANYSQMN